MAWAYYNEIDPFAAEWLRRLIAAGHIAPGVVDERSIVEVQPDELEEFTQCHFFAGIGGWSYAARLAGWPDDRELWTGSCPCQPFSVAGARRGDADERHLWPELARIVSACRPAVLAGEQVASKAGRAWCAGVRADLEALGYAFGAADLCAASVGAPHIRQRLFWVADAHADRFEGVEERDSRAQRDGEACEFRHDADGRGVVHGGVGNADGGRARRHRRAGAGAKAESSGGRQAARGVGHAAYASGTDRGLGDALGEGLEGHSGDEHPGHEPGRHDAPAAGPAPATGGDCWAGVYIPCADGKARRIEPGLEPLVDGLPGRVGRLRAYGNAIVPQVAAAFLEAFMEVKR